MNWLKRIKEMTPGQDVLNDQPHLQNIFGAALRNREIWSFNRVSVARGCAVGLFCAFLPMPGETIAAGFIAIFLRANLPLSLAGVWISNPVTWVPMYTPPYLFGAWILGIEPVDLASISVLTLGWHYVALWLGCLITGTILAFTVNWLVNFIWRDQIRQAWQARRRKRMLQKIDQSIGESQD